MTLHNILLSVSTNVNFLIIGYGDIVAHSDAGKLATMIYAIPGIAIAVTTYTYAGHALCVLSKILIVFIERKVMKHNKIKQCDIKVFIIQVILCLTMMLIQAAIHSREDMQNIRYFDSIYTMFITLTTIGFGDFSHDIDTHMVKNVWYMFIIDSLLFLIGLATTASIITSISNIMSSKQPVSCCCCKSVRNITFLCCSKKSGRKMSTQTMASTMNE